MPQSTMSAGRPKRRRTPEEIDTVATRFRPGWQAGDPVQTWINQHEAELSFLVSEGWSWADVGQAMFAAGITFRTGKPIPGPTLRLKAYLARKVGRKDEIRDEVRHQPGRSPIPTPPSPALPPTPREKPKFEFVRMRDPEEVRAELERERAPLTEERQRLIDRAFGRRRD